MSDKLTEIINSRLMFSGASMFTSKGEKFCREIAEEFAASEIDRLLDLLVEDKAASYTFTWSSHSGFSWTLNHPHDAAVGHTKENLLKYIGFTESKDD